MQKIQKYFKEGFFRGIGWSFGATVGFALISSFLYYTVKYAGGVPLIGTWIAGIVQATQAALYR